MNKWLDKNGFNQDGVTFIYFPADSYQVKEELKNAGFIFSKLLLWHAATVPSGYEESCIAVTLDQVAELSAWGEGFYRPDTREIIDNLIKEVRPVKESNSCWIGDIKDKIKDLPVKLTNIRGFNGNYGYSQIVRFETEEGDIIKWFTSVNIPFEVGDILFLSGTIKDLVNDKYEDGAEVTIMTRCNMEEI